eukprot:748764-Hanusia_phi.AAC.2
MGNSSSTLPSRKTFGSEGSIWTLTCNELCESKSERREVSYASPISTAPVRPMHFASSASQEGRRMEGGRERSFGIRGGASAQDGETLFLTDRDQKFKIPVKLQDAELRLSGRKDMANLQRDVDTQVKSPSSSRRPDALAAGRAAAEWKELLRERAVPQTVGLNMTRGGGSVSTGDGDKSVNGGEEMSTDQRKELLERLHKNLSRFPPRHHSVPNIATPYAGEGKEVNISPTMLNAQRVV